MSDDERTDEQLVELVVAGQRDLYAELVRRHQGLVASVAWRYGVAADEIEDVVSEVFLKVFQRLHRYRPDHAFSTWLYRVGANHVLDRGRRRRQETAPPETAESLADERPAAPENLERRERAQLLRAALRALRPAYREVIFLVHLEGRRVEDAAAELGLPTGTVKTRLMRGRRALAEILRERHPEHFGERNGLPSRT
jgi:RNA polymerase sigma-70 factor (ECF subfamily)